jgi:alpha-galactosidase
MTDLHLPDLIFAVGEDKSRTTASDLAQVSITFEANGLQISVREARQPLTQIVLRWKGALSKRPLRLLGDHWERGYGDLEWRGIVPERKMPWYFLGFDGETTFGIGVETGASAICWWQVDEQGFSLTCDVSNGGAGVLLGDRELSVARVRQVVGQPGESPFQVTKRLCRTLCPRPRLPAQPVYGGNDWYFAYGNNSAELIRRHGGFIGRLAPDSSNRPYMVIDDGWFPSIWADGGCNGGPYLTGNARFFDMPGLAHDLKQQDGVRPGLWMRPLLTQETEISASWQMPESHPLRLGKERGTFLDPSVPDVLDRVKSDVSRVVEWGYELIKHDFSTYDILGRWGFGMSEELTSSGWHFADRSRTTAEIITALYTTMREAAGDDAILMGCNTVGHLGAGLFELQRTGDDTSGRNWERTRKMGVNTLAFRLAQHNTFFAADAECVGLTGKVPWHLNRQWLDVLARSGTPLFVSADLDAVGPEQEMALREAFTRAARPDVEAQALDWTDTTCPTNWRFRDGQEEQNKVYHWSELG